MSDGFLRPLLTAIREDLARPEYLHGLPPARPRPPPSLRAAVDRAAGGGALIVEFKRNSPGAREPELPVRSVPDFLARVAGAPVAGLSCVATRARFAGSVEDVAALARRTSLPVLFKDFVVDPIQLAAAERAGASAVLLIARLEEEGLLSVPLAALAREAHRRGLEILLELHAKAELRRVPDVAADMFGVNVRNLDSLAMEPEVAADTLRAAARFRPLLGLSGVDGPAEAARFWSLGADGLLVGSAAARAQDPVGFLTSLLRPEVRP